MELMIEDLMEQLIEMGGSDLHLTAGLPPYFRISGHLQPISDQILSSEECQRLIFSMLNNTQRKNLEQNWELDCSYGVRGFSDISRTTSGSPSLSKLGIFELSARKQAA